MKNLIKILKTNKAFSVMELLIVLAIVAILLLILPNLNLFLENAVKKEGVQLVRSIIEQERVYKADNGAFSTNCESIQNWKTIKTLLLDNKYFKPEGQLGSKGKIGYSSSGSPTSTDNFNKVIQDISIPQNCSSFNKEGEKCKLEVEIKASYKTKAAGWHIKGHLIEGKEVKNKKGDLVPSKIVFEENKENSSGQIANDSWQEVAL